MVHFVYLLKCSDGEYYTGIADNPIALGAILLGFAGSLFVVSKKLKASEIA